MMIAALAACAGLGRRSRAGNRTSGAGARETTASGSPICAN